MTRLLVLVLVGAFALGGCSSDDGDEAAPSTSEGDAATSTSRADDSTTTTAGGGSETIEVSGDTTVDATVGETFTIALEANETTGYRWSESVEGDAIEARGGSYEAEATDRIGSGGTQLYTYDAVAAGTATISLTYAQVGSGDVGQSITVTVDVT